MVPWFRISSSKLKNSLSVDLFLSLSLSLRASSFCLPPGLASSLALLLLLLVLPFSSAPPPVAAAAAAVSLLRLLSPVSEG